MNIFFFILVKSNLSIENFVVSAFHVFSKKFLPNPRFQEIFPCILLEVLWFLAFMFTMIFFDYFFCVCYEVGNEIHFSQCLSSVAASFILKTSHSLLICPGPFI